MCYLEKFEKNVLSNRDIFNLFMTSFPEKVKTYIRLLKESMGEDYLDSQQIELIKSYYSKTISENGFINDSYIEFNVDFFCRKDASFDSYYTFVFDEFEIAYLFFSYSDTRERFELLNKDSDFFPTLCCNSMLNSDKNVVRFPVAPMFVPHMFSDKVLSKIKENMTFSLPFKDLRNNSLNYSIKDYLEINHRFINGIDKSLIVDGLSKYLSESECSSGYSSVFSFISQYSSSDSSNLYSNIIASAFYDLVCQDYFINELYPTIQKRQDLSDFDGLYPTIQERQVFYDLFVLQNLIFSDKIMQYALDMNDSLDNYNSKREKLVELFFKLDPICDNTIILDDVFLTDVIIHLAKDETLNASININNFDKLPKNVKEIAYSIRSQITLLSSTMLTDSDVDSFWNLLVGNTVFDSKYNLLDIIGYDDYAMLLVIFGDHLFYFYCLNPLNDFLNSNKDDLFELKKREITHEQTDENFDSVENKDTYYSFKDNAFEKLVDFYTSLKL